MNLSPSGFHRVSYQDWGGVCTFTVIGAHGLTRTSHDFDDLAQDIVPFSRFVCPDMPGRGHSEPLVDPSLYTLPQYAQCATALIARLGAADVHWVGTSMGGLIGLVLAAQKQTPISSLVLNDIGPFISSSTLHAFKEHLFSAEPGVGGFATLEQAKEAVAKRYNGFDHFAPDVQERIASSYLKQDKEGEIGAPGVWRFHYDPAIVKRHRANVPHAHSTQNQATQNNNAKNVMSPMQEGDLNLWSLWDKITCPILVLRGENSHLLSHETLERMKASKPQGQVSCVVFPHKGHPLELVDAQERGVVSRWLMDRAGGRST